MWTPARVVFFGAAAPSAFQSCFDASLTRGHPRSPLARLATKREADSVCSTATRPNRTRINSGASGKIRVIRHQGLYDRREDASPKREGETGFPPGLPALTIHEPL